MVDMNTWGQRAIGAGTTLVVAIGVFAAVSAGNAAEPQQREETTHVLVPRETPETFVVPASIVKADPADVVETPPADIPVEVPVSEPVPEPIEAEPQPPADPLAPPADQPPGDIDMGAPPVDPPGVGGPGSPPSP